MAHAWGTLLSYVRTGKPAYREIFGRPFWEDLAAHPEIAADFDALMGPAGHGVPGYDIELSGGWDHIRSIVDVGGGTGTMLVNLLRRHPGARGTLVDLPSTVARADLADVADRPDAETVAILSRCREAAGADGRVVVIGGVSPGHEQPPLAIDMLVAGGKTSSTKEFSGLAAQAGLTVAATSQQAAGFVIECR